jgi:ABC-type multidrug transport system ATPase subunit
MEALRDIARSGRTVIASLHQPRSDIYNMADNYVILAKRGNVIFQGPRDALIPHFALAGHACPPLYNPSDFSMDLVSVDVRGKRRQQETQGRVNSLIAHWQAHEGKIAEMQESTRAPSDSVALDARQENTPIWIALPVVLGRSWRNTWRQSDLFWTR